MSLLSCVCVYFTIPFFSLFLCIFYQIFFFCGINVIVRAFNYCIHFISDINECALARHECSHLCSNTDGSYTCACRDGYSLDSNSRTCSVSCGGRLTAKVGSFQTPDWPHRYPQENFDCEWIMDNLSPQESVKFEVDKSAYGINGIPPCAIDYIEFFDGVNSSASSLGKYCHIQKPDPIIISTGGARVVFHALKMLNPPPSRVGVKIFYIVTGWLPYFSSILKNSTALIIFYIAVLCGNCSIYF